MFFLWFQTEYKLINSLNSLSHHMETSHLICRANQLTGFYMIATLALNELISVSIR